MGQAPSIDVARLTLLLNKLRLPTIKAVWPRFAEEVGQQGGSAANQPPGKTLEEFEFTAVPGLFKAQVMALNSGDSWLAHGANAILFGSPSGGKSTWQLASGWGWWKRAIVCFTPAPPSWFSGCRWPAESLR